MHEMSMTSAFARRIRGMLRAPDIARAMPYVKSAAAMAVFARARVGPGLAPMAAAYFASALLTGENLPALLTGCAIGAFVIGFEPESLYAPAACAVTLSTWLLWDFLSRKFPRVKMDDASIPIALAGFSVLLPGLAAAGDKPQYWLVSLLAAVGAALMAAVFSYGYPTRAAQGRITLAACACAGVLCARSLTLDPVPFAAAFAVAAGAAGRGALFGAALGALCAISGSGPGGMAIVCVAGGAADAAELIRPGALWRSLAACAAWAAMRIWLGAEASIWILAACAGQALIPRRAQDGIAEAFGIRVRRDERVTLALRRRSEASLRAMSDAFLALSEACGATDPTYGEQLLLARMRSALCAGCPDYAACWPGSNSRAVKLFCQLMSASIECGGSPFDNGEIPPEIRRLCRRGMTVPARLGALLNDFAAQRHRKLRLMEARRLIGAQFSQAAELLNALAMDQAKPLSARDGAAARARESLIAAGLPIKEVVALKSSALEITIELRKPWTEDELSRAERGLSFSLGRPFVLETQRNATAVFTPRCALSAPAGASALPAEPDLPSGDSHMIRRLPGDKLLVAISDGMGSGEAAAEESDKVLRLIHALVAAEVPRELTVSTVNGVMLARGGEELFATVDMLLIDLANARAEFTKLSACRSYIVRAGEVMTIEGGRLPLGILEEVQPGITNVNVRAGDLIVMMTDGVAEALPEEVMEDLVVNAAFAPSEAIAEALVNAAAARAAKRRDDMTAVCVKIERA
ncbi:MAG: SpoIIE family protein phosphatase [Christensenellales bacterium]|jgi:stage II sporulation protein E